MFGYKWPCLILMSIMIMDSNCLETVYLSFDQPAFSIHGDDVSTSLKNLEFNVTDCFDCTLEMRWSKLESNDNRSIPFIAVTDGDTCRNFASVNCLFSPPVAESPEYLYGQCYKSIHRSVFQLDDDLVTKEPFALTVAVSEYVKIQDHGNNTDDDDFVTFPVEKLPPTELAQMIVGTGRGPGYGYFVAVAPKNEMIFTRTLQRDSRGERSCEIEVFSGTLPSFNDSSHLLFKLGPDEMAKDIIWRVSTLTYRFSDRNCFAFIEHRIFLEVSDTNGCENGRLSAPFVFPIMSHGYPESTKKPFLESKCFVTDTAPQTRVSLFVEQIVGGSLEIIFEDHNEKSSVTYRITPELANKTICQITANKVTYNWYPNKQAEESRILGKIRVTSYEDDPDCRKEQMQLSEEDHHLSKGAKIGIIIGAVVVTFLVVSLCCCCLRCVFKLNPKSRNDSIRTEKSDSVLVFDEPETLEDRIARLPSISQNVRMYPSLSLHESSVIDFH